MGPFDPNAMTPGMGGVSVTLGSYHGTMDTAWVAVKKVNRTKLELLSSDELVTALMALNAGYELSRTDEDTDSYTFVDEIRLVEAEIKRREK